MGRPPGPKKLAAMEQLQAMRQRNLPDDEIRMKLIESGLTRAQALELVPMAPEPERLKPEVDAVDKTAIIDGAIHYLESIAKRITPNAVDRFSELGLVKHDALTWARKLKGAK